MDVIYIGLPFFFWQEDESEHGLDVHVTEGFQKLGSHVYPLNAGDDAEEICSAYNWHTSFVDEDEDITPSEEFISEHVLWDDFRLLYISAAAATSEDEYTQFVCHTAEFAKESGLVVAAEVVDGDMKTRIHGAIRRRSSGPAAISCHREVRPVPCAWPWAGASPLPARAKNGPMTSRSSVNVSSLRFYKDCWKGAIPFPS